MQMVTQRYKFSKNRCVCAQSSDSLQPVNYSPLGSSVNGISQARILEWVAVYSSKGSSPEAELRGLLSSGRVGSGQKVCLMIKPGGEERKKIRC